MSKCFICLCHTMSIVFLLDSSTFVLYSEENFVRELLCHRLTLLGACGIDEPAVCERYAALLRHFVTRGPQVALATELLGPNVCFTHQQFIIKHPDARGRTDIPWHQDSGYVKWYDPTTNHKPYVTCWCTLDAVNEENGTVYILPHSRAGTRGKLIDPRDKTAGVKNRWAAVPAKWPRYPMAVPSS